MTVKRGFRMSGKSEKGFTLLEVIMSVAVVSIVSVFILEMFVVSGRVNKKAFETDNASMICMGTVEAFKSGTAPDGGYREAYYDGDWKTAAAAADAEYILKITVFNEETDIYGIDAVVTRAGGDEVASLKATKYFPRAGAEGGV